MHQGDTLPTVERMITQEGIDKYAAASGDFNPIHVDREFAAASRFGSTVAHGMMVAATISEAMTTVFGRDWLEGGRLKLRFKAPVFPGDTVRTSGRVKNVRGHGVSREVTCTVEVRRQDGEAAITGEAMVASRY